MNKIETRYRRVLIDSAGNATAQMRVDFEVAMNELCEQQNQWWYQQNEDAEAGLLREWTDAD